ncbi:MAG: hypothetical protein ACXWIE_18375 [Burkholderiales bacterium]
MKTIPSSVKVLAVPIRENRERQIEDAVIGHPEVLGFPGASAIRNVRVAWGFGTIDVMLFPRSGPTKLVLVEAKHASASDAISKVVGQLVMYYAGALDIGSTGLACYRRYAEEHPERALSTGYISPKQLTSGVSPPLAAWKVMHSGEKLRPEEVRLFIALNAPPHKALQSAIAVLSQSFGLNIGLLVATNGMPELLTSLNKS